ncbi:MAG: type II toxin-antitoxin system ParD family antitoxin [Saprospiraceae bacterium]
MTITLNPEQERLLAQALQDGAYRNASDVIARALEVLRAEDGWLHERREDVSAKIDRAFEQFDRGEFYTDQQSRADMEQRKAAWLRDQQP